MMQSKMTVCKVTGKEKCENCEMYKQWWKSREECWNSNKEERTKVGHRILMNDEKKLKDL